MWRPIRVCFLAGRYHTSLSRVVADTNPSSFTGGVSLRVAVIKWPDVALWPEVRPDVMVDAAIGDSDFLFYFVSAEVLAEVCEDGIWRV